MAGGHQENGIKMGSFHPFVHPKWSCTLPPPRGPGYGFLGVQLGSFEGR